MQPNTQYYGSNYHHRYSIYFDNTYFLIFFVTCEDMTFAVGPMDILLIVVVPELCNFESSFFFLPVL